MSLDETTSIRGQFTFYRSYWEAISNLPQKDQLTVLKAIIEYGLDGTEHDLKGVAAAMFFLVKPTLDVGRRKAAVGKQGGSKQKANGKQKESKKKAKCKQTASEKEKEKEKEVEIEKEIEIENDSSISPITPFDEFWAAYPKKVGKGDARKAFQKVKVPLETILKAVEAQKASAQWTKEDGRFIPNPSTWLNQERWCDELPNQAGYTASAGEWIPGEAELDAIRRIMKEN